MHLDQMLAVFIAGAIAGSIVVYSDPFSTSGNPMGMPAGEPPIPGEMGNSGMLGAPDALGAAPDAAEQESGPTSAPTAEVEGNAATETTEAEAFARSARSSSRAAGNGHGGGDTAPRLTKHLASAPSLWRLLADEARESGNPAQARLANDIAKQAELVPSMTDRLPPLSDMTAYMVSSQALIERMKAAGIDCGVLEVQIADLMKPRGAAR